MRHLTTADYTRRKWKNGGGETTQLAIFPSGASLDTFVWRISMATIAEDGPFSAFPGVDRTLVVASGAGIELMVAGERYRLGIEDPPHRFAGDATAFARLADGPVIDVNVMTRRDRADHEVSVLSIGVPLIAAGDSTFLLSLDAGQVAVDGMAYHLAIHDLLALDRGAAAKIIAGKVLAIRIRLLGEN